MSKAPGQLQESVVALGTRQLKKLQLFSMRLQQATYQAESNSQPDKLQSAAPQMGAEQRYYLIVQTIFYLLFKHHDLYIFVKIPWNCIM